jgi:hypothetical protein
MGDYATSPIAKSKGGGKSHEYIHGYYLESLKDSLAAMVNQFEKEEQAKKDLVENIMAGTNMYLTGRNLVKQAHDSKLHSNQMHHGIHKLSTSDAAYDEAWKFKEKTGWNKLGDWLLGTRDKIEILDFNKDGVSDDADIKDAYKEFSEVEDPLDIDNNPKAPNLATEGEDDDGGVSINEEQAEVGGNIHNPDEANRLLNESIDNASLIADDYTNQLLGLSVYNEDGTFKSEYDKVTPDNQYDTSPDDENMDDIEFNDPGDPDSPNYIEPPLASADELDETDYSAALMNTNQLADYGDDLHTASDLINDSGFRSLKENNLKKLMNMFRV